MATTIQAPSPFAPTFYLFQANAAALSIRLRRPKSVIRTEGSACLMGIGGRAEAKCGKIALHDVLFADSFTTAVTGDFVDLKAASKLTDSHGGQRARWHENTLEILTTTECTVKGFHAINFDSPKRSGGPTLHIDKLAFKMEGRHKRTPKADLDIKFKDVGFSGVAINGRALKVSADTKRFDGLPSFDAFKSEYNRSAALRKELGERVYRPAGGNGATLHDQRGFCTVTVVNKIEWVKPGGADPKIEINGHSVYVPGYGTIYFGEMTIAPTQRRLHMVRSELGCPDGGGNGGGLGCPGGHEHP